MLDSELHESGIKLFLTYLKEDCLSFKHPGNNSFEKWTISKHIFQ